jgi:hypothetical protein
MIRSCVVQNSFQAAAFVPFPAGYAARSPWIRCSTTNFVKRSKALATRTAEATLFLTLPPAEKVHKINEITAWLPDRREQEKAEGGKSFRESTIRTIPSQSPERGTGLRRTCRINGLDGERERQGFFASRLARRVVAQPSMLTCLARLTARAPAGTSLVMQEPAPI